MKKGKKERRDDTRTRGRRRKTDHRQEDREGTEDERREVELLMESVVCGLHISFVGDEDT